jgi:hypothetical protein
MIMYLSWACLPTKAGSSPIIPPRIKSLRLKAFLF